MKDKSSGGLSVAQVIAGALASVSAAILASKFGVAGTVIGAAFTSVTVTIGSVLYRRSIEQARDRVRIRYRRSPGGPERPVEFRRPRRRLAWGAIIGGAIVIFAVAMGGLTAFETVAKAPAAHLMGDYYSGSAQTTVGALFQGISSDGSGRESPSPSPSASESSAPDDTTPTVTPTDAVPSPSPTPAIKSGTNIAKPKTSEPAVAPSRSPDLAAPSPTKPPTPAASPEESPSLSGE